MANVADDMSKVSGPDKSAVKKLFDDARKRLVETGTRNRLVHVNRKNSRASVVNVVNERSDDVYEILSSGKAMRFLAIGRDKDTEDNDLKLANAGEPGFDAERYTDAQHQYSVLSLGIPDLVRGQDLRGAEGGATRSAAGTAYPQSEIQHVRGPTQGR